MDILHVGEPTNLLPASGVFGGFICVLKQFYPGLRQGVLAFKCRFRSVILWFILSALNTTSHYCPCPYWNDKPPHFKHNGNCFSAPHPLLRSRAATVIAQACMLTCNQRGRHMRPDFKFGLLVWRFSRQPVQIQNHQSKRVT